MSQPVILDACTIINLLRIDDEDDEFLYKHITALNLYIAEKVHNEVKNKYKKNPLLDNQEKYIDRCIAKLFYDLVTNKKFYKDADIVNEISSHLFDEIKSFGLKKYNKENGELYSTALGLIVSRTEGDRVCFYTDDKPATEYFIPYFYYQQIGTIMDTVDLLIYLYWTNSDFETKRLKNYLQGLYSDINYPLKLLVNEIVKIKNSFSASDYRDRSLLEYVNMIIDGYYQLDISRITIAADYLIKKKRGSKIANAIEKYGYKNLENNCPLIVKIKTVRDNMNKFNLYKI